MGPVVVLDTNILIYHADGTLATPLSTGNFAVSVISEIEAFGFRHLTPETEFSLRQLRSSVTVIGVDEDIKLEAIRLRQSTRLRTPDAIIAATAIVLGAELYTNDRSLHGIQGLKASALAIR